MNLRDNNKASYRAELISQGNRFIPGIRVLGTPTGGKALIDVRRLLVAAFDLAEGNDTPIIDLVAVTHSGPLFAATVALAIIERLDDGGAVKILVRPGGLEGQLKRLLPKSVMTQGLNSTRNCLELQLSPSRRQA
jgi:hypothetical protein